MFQFGDAIAIVCADTEAHAKAAAEKVKVDLEELPAYMSAPAAMADDAIEIHPGTPNVYYELKIAKGEETKPLMEKAAYVVEDDFYLQTAAPPDHRARRRLCLLSTRRAGSPSIPRASASICTTP